MKNYFTFLLLAPIIYLTSCSSGDGILTPPSPTAQSELVGSWERTGIGYHRAEWLKVENQTWLINNGEDFYLTGTAMMEFFDYDRYVIELRSDSTYKNYTYTGSAATTSEGSWIADSVSITFDGHYSIPYTKNGDSYEIDSPSLEGSTILTGTGDNGWDLKYIIDEVYEHFDKID